MKNLKKKILKTTSLILCIFVYLLLVFTWDCGGVALNEGLPSLNPSFTDYIPDQDSSVLLEENNKRLNAFSLTVLVAKVVVLCGIAFVGGFYLGAAVDSIASYLKK